MRHGDFTALAKAYVHRPGYSPSVIRCLIRLVGAERASFRVADVGAGTGKLTEMLSAFGLRGYAVEPNDAMREEAAGTLADARAFKWIRGTAEATGLQSESVDWVCMASAFHWADPAQALKEFHRILRPGGYLTVLWNPRDLDHDQFQRHVEDLIRKIVPDLERRSSGAPSYTQNVETILLSDGWFGDVLYTEAPHAESMSRERYVGVWESVNDVQVQAGPDRWHQILAAIRRETKGTERLRILYRTRAWTVRAREC